jgi:uncharacterized protein YsxB (DUF464 family)
MEVKVSFDSDGILCRVEAKGHAGSEPAGSNPACAAATVLLRTAYETLSSTPGVQASGEAPSPGLLHFTVKHYPAGLVQRLRGIGDFLLVGLSSVEREYPGKINVIIDGERRK